MIHRADRLDRVHPDLARVVRLAAERAPFDLFVVEGIRTLERQRMLVAAGASKTLKSRHLTGHAVDLAPMIDFDGDGDLDPRFDWPLYYKLAPVVKAAAKELEIPIAWGGDWLTFKDGPHFELRRSAYPA